MKLVGQTWMPSDDSHFFFNGPPFYQKKSFKAAMKYVRKFDCAVDIGAHVGFFTRYMAERFKQVHAFEPEPGNFSCLVKNIPKDILRADDDEIRVSCQVFFWEHGIAEKDVLGNMVNPTWYNSGAWEFHEDSLGTARAMKLGTSLHPDFIKIDVQGMEKKVLLGCSDVLERDKPVLLVECERDGEVSNHLEAIGYKMAERTGANITWVPA